MDASVMELRLTQWKEIFEAQAKSGLNKQEWCEKNGIRRWEFFRRQRELRQYLMKDMQPADETEPRTTELPAVSETFVELPIVSDSPTVLVPVKEQTPGSVEISHGKFRITLKGSIDSSMLECIIKAVAHA